MGSVKGEGSELSGVTEFFDLEDGSEGHKVSGEWRKKTGSEGWVGTVAGWRWGRKGFHTVGRGVKPVPCAFF